MFCGKQRRSRTPVEPPRPVLLSVPMPLPQDHPHATSISKPPSPAHSLVRSPSIISKLKSRIKGSIINLRGEPSTPDLANEHERATEHAKMKEIEEAMFEDSQLSNHKTDITSTIRNEDIMGRIVFLESPTPKHRSTMRRCSCNDLVAKRALMKNRASSMPIYTDKLEPYESNTQHNGDAAWP